MSEAQKKRYEDPEERRKISLGNKGKKQSEEARRKVSDAQKGKPKSEKQRRKMNGAQKKRWGTNPATPTGKVITCEIIKKHHEKLKEDPDHLSTEFIQKLIGIDCDKK
jgi:hypothetical protein